MKTSEIIKLYGQPGDVKNLTTIILPYEMRIAWDLKRTVTKMQVHKLAASSLTKIFNEILKC